MPIVNAFTVSGHRRSGHVGAETYGEPQLYVDSCERVLRDERFQEVLPAGIREPCRLVEGTLRSIRICTTSQMGRGEIVAGLSHRYNGLRCDGLCPQQHHPRPRMSHLERGLFQLVDAPRHPPTPHTHPLSRQCQNVDIDNGTNRHYKCAVE